MRKKSTLSFVAALAFIFTVLISIVGYRAYNNYETARKEAESQKLHDALTATIKGIKAEDELDDKKLSPQALGAKRAEAARKADLAATTSRAEIQRFVNDIATMFPVGPSAMCYQSAISNYVEDRWNEIARQNGCVEDLSVCNNHQASNIDDFSATNMKTRRELYNTWFIAAALYNYMRSLNLYFVGNRSTSDAPSVNISAGEFTARIDNLNKYISECQDLKPVGWSVVGEPLAQTYPAQLTVGVIKLGVYKLLIEKIATRTLPDEQKTYASCLSTYVQMTGKTHKNDNDVNDRCGDDKKCIETIPVDTKEYLFQTLDDLKAHDCLSSYIYEKEHR